MAAADFAVGALRAAMTAPNLERLFDLHEAFEAPQLARLEKVAAAVKQMQDELNEEFDRLVEERKELRAELLRAEEDWHEVKGLGPLDIDSSEYEGRRAAYEVALDDLNTFDAAHADELKPWGQA
jgi:chromosome segregation ATPase